MIYFFKNCLSDFDCAPVFSPALEIIPVTFRKKAQNIIIS